MESAWPLILFLAFLFGSTLLVLISGYFSIEKEREEAGISPAPAGAQQFALPRFFVHVAPDGQADGLRELDSGLVASIERFLREEHQLAVEFVGDPSLRGFHAQPPAEDASEEGLFDRIERFLRSEQVLAAAFVSEPSVESLYGRLQPAVAI